MIRPTPTTILPSGTPATTPTKAGDPSPPKRRGRPPKAGPKAPPESKTTRPGAGLKGSPEAKRKASVILEVLGGLRSPTSGATVLGVSVQRYYTLEVRALQGLLSALDTKPRGGGQPSPDATIRRLTAERERLERELLRAQALLRVAQRAVGLSPPPTPAPALKGTKGTKGKPAHGKRGPRKPTVRARRAADELRSAAAKAVEPTTTTTTTQPTPGPTSTPATRT